MRTATESCRACPWRPVSRSRRGRSSARSSPKARMTPSPRSFCADISAETGEPVGGTASRVDHWLLVEYRGVWNPDALAGSGLSDQVKAHLRSEIAALRPAAAKLLFVRRRERRDAGLVAFRSRLGHVRRYDF